MKKTSAYSPTDWVRAVNLSVVMGWFYVSAPIIWGLSNGTWQNLISLTIWAAAIGQPIAFGVSWVISAPILKRIMRNRVTWLGATVWGGAVAFLIAIFSIVTGRLYRLMRSSSYQIGGGDKIQDVDGILTAYGWSILCQRTVFLVFGGVLIALFIRAVIGPGRAVSDCAKT